jgi:protein phosphatase-4 regulatory subunit 3
VYELKDSNWIDRGTGQCKGVYDDSQDLAMIIVETEDPPGEKEGEGGFLREDNLLLRTKVEKEEIYSRQQGIYILDLCYRSADIIVTDTLIVWNEPISGLDIALSFQDVEGCEDIWLFITEVQRHLNNVPRKLHQFLGIIALNLFRH